MTTGFQMYVNGEEVTPPGGTLDNGAEWDATWEERIDGVGTATVTIQDRLNSAREYGSRRDHVELTVNGAMVFEGEITGSELSLPPGRPFRRWKITASDWNTVFDTRYVGLPNGNDWETIDGGATHTPIDPNAHGTSSDRTTVQNLFDDYVRIQLAETPSGPFPAFDTSTFVGHFIPRSILVDPTGESRLRWTHAPLGSALDELRGLAGFPIYRWIDPDRKVHWSNLPVPRPGPTLGPRSSHVRLAPAVISDTGTNGTTIIGGRGLRIVYDGTYMPQEAYVVGVTDFIYNGGSTIQQGTGLGGGLNTSIRHFRQIVVDAQSVTRAQRDSVAKHYGRYRLRARIKGSITIGGPFEVVDGWRCGQALRIYDERLPASLNGVPFPIQRVSGRLMPGNDFRVYQIEFGDAPIGQFSQKYRSGVQKLPTARLAAKTHRIYLPTTHLRPSTSYVLHSQMVDHSRKPVRQKGIPVTWSLTVRDRAGVAVATGSISAITSVTDQHGRTAATLTTGAATDLHYHASCVTAAQ